MLTTSSCIFVASREQAMLVADCCGLRHLTTSCKEDARMNGSYPLWYGDHFDLWEDNQTGGGGCRIVWSRGIAWISRHSGYEWADITGEAAWAFRELGCKNTDWDMLGLNPHTYGSRREDDEKLVAAAQKYYRTDGD